MRHEFSIRAKEGQPPLTVEQMRQVAPALFAPAPHESRSQRYVYVDTREVMDGLMKEGFLPVEVRQSRCRDLIKRYFTKHMVRFRKAGDGGERKVGDVSTEVIMRNAHDGTAAYDFMAGLFRLACLNGMVVHTSTIEAVHVRHSGNREKIVGQVIEGAYTVLNESVKALEAPKTWGEIQLSRDELRLAELGHAGGDRIYLLWGVQARVFRIWR